MLGTFSSNTSFINVLPPDWLSKSLCFFCSSTVDGLFNGSFIKQSFTNSIIALLHLLLFLSPGASPYFIFSIIFLNSNFF